MPNILSFLGGNNEKLFNLSEYTKPDEEGENKINPQIKNVMKGLKNKI